MSRPSAQRATRRFPAFVHAVLTAAVAAVPLAAAGTPAVPPPARAIYQCPGDQGIPRFSQFPCRELEPHSEPIDLAPLQVLRVAPLGAAERRRLEQLKRQRDLQRRDRVRAQRDARRESQRQRQARIERCHAARAALEDLRDERRHGYSLRRAPALERREAELDARVRADC